MAHGLSITPYFYEKRKPRLPLTPEEIKIIRECEFIARFDDGLFRLGENGWERINGAQ